MLNPMLDLDKHEPQVVAEDRETDDKTVPASFAARILAENRSVMLAP